MHIFCLIVSLFKLGKIQFWLSSTTMQQFDVFLFENLQKICRESTVMKTIFSKVSVLQNRLRYGCLSISFPNTFLWLLPNIEHKRIPVNDNIVWCKYSRGIKNLSKSGSCFLLNYPKYLGATLFHSLYAQTLRIF